MIGDKRSRLALGKRAYKTLCLKVMSRDKQRCRCCSSRQNLHCHHIKFRSQGGDDAEWNLITMCLTCHEALHNRWIELVQEGMEKRGFIDANLPVKFWFLQGYKPKYSKKRAA